MVDVLIWNTEVKQECSGGCFNLEHSGQSGGQWMMYLSGTQWSNRSSIVDVNIWNIVVNPECSSQYSNLEHSGQSGGQWLMYLSGTK